VRRRIAIAALGVVLPLSAYAALSSLSPHDDMAAAMPSAFSVALPNLQVERTITLQKGEDLSKMLTRAGFSEQQTSQLMSTLKGKVNTGALKAGQKFELSYTEAAPYTIDTASLTFRHGPGQEARLNLRGSTATASFVKHELKQRQAVAVGRIKDSLYQDATDANVPPGLIKPFMDLFAWDIDYTRDIQPGDTFKITYEETVDDRGQRVKTGRILAASFTVGKRTQQAFWYVDENGRGDYYNEKGEGKRKLLLRTPLETYRISSHFNLKRKHPILGFTRAHKGTDFAAPTGTPVKASGDGVVTFVGFHGGHGKFIKIRHNATFTTAYAHLHRYSKGIKVGSRVKQGQIIAQVGSTGASTGPHLHYEVIKNGVHVNAMSTDLPTGTMMAGKAKGQFKAMVASIQSAWEKAFQVADNNTEKPKQRG
jgi:murein DD-endopeptidase MepM/ murein hydrolase activator NlpD